MFSIDAARETISPRIANDGSATAFSKTGAGGGGATASGPFAFAGSAVSVASDERSGSRTLDHSSSSTKKRTTTTRPVFFAK